MALPGMYGSFIHENQVDADLMAGMRPKAVVVMDPSAAKVAKIWARVKAQNAYIVLRKWEWDDNRSEQNPEGTYRELWADPVGYGRKFTHQWGSFVTNFYHDGQKQGLELPPYDRLICHLQNEPDTNGADKQIAIDRFTETAVLRANEISRRQTVPVYLGCFNFGTGHPAELKDGKPDWSPFAGSLAAIKGSLHWVLLHEYKNNLPFDDPSINPWHIFRHKWAPLADRYNVGIAEWGVEQLVNNLEPRAHGWQGKETAQRFANDYLAYCNGCAPWVQWVSIFASDTPGWETFDPAPAKDELLRVAQTLWGGQGQIDDPPTIPPISPPTAELIMPCTGTVTLRFGENYVGYMEKFGIPGHNGIDIGNVEGTPVVAIADGVVAWQGWDNDYGNYIRVFHPQYKFHSFFGHLSQIDMRGGEQVKQGQQIGLMGNTGSSTGPHLHFEIRMGEEFTYWDVTYGHGKGRCNPEVVYVLLNGRGAL